MANVFMTGFEWGTKYEVSWWDAWGMCAIDATNVRSGNYSMKLYGAYAAFSQSLAGGKNEYYVQFAYNTDGAFGSLGGSILNWYGSYGDRRIGYLNFSDTGQARLYTVTHPDGLNENSVLRAVGLKRLRTNAWYVLELHIKADQNFGALALRIDGTPDCDFAGATSEYSPGTIDAMTWAHWSCYIDDIVINDTLGDFNNSWPGSLKVVLLRPNDDGGSSQWTKSIEGHNYDCVNEVPYDTSQYVYTYGLDQLDLYGLQDLPEEAADVMVVRGDAWAFKDSGSEAQNRKLAFSVQAGMTINDSPDQNLALSYDLVKYPFDFSPDTNAIWTKEEVNNIQAGIKSRA